MVDTTKNYLKYVTIGIWTPEIGIGVSISGFYSLDLADDHVYRCAKENFIKGYYLKVFIKDSPEYIEYLEECKTIVMLLR